MASTKLDVAVVGGGVSGACSAWRLQQERGQKQHIGLFEYSDRIGGRLYTITMPGLPNVKAEVGGMRYIPKRQLLRRREPSHLRPLLPGAGRLPDRAPPGRDRRRPGESACLYVFGPDVFVAGADHRRKEKKRAGSM